MDPEDIEQEQEDTQPSENQDRNSPQNPSQNSRSGGLNRLRNQFGKSSGGPPAFGKIKSKLGGVKNQGKQAAKQASKDVIKKAAAASLKNPYVLAVVGIVLLIIFIIILIITIISGESEALSDEAHLTITKTGPDQAVKNQTLTYQIAVSYSGTAQNITITDHIPDDTDYVQSSPSAQFDPATRIATWNLRDPQASPGATLSDVNKTILLTLKATKDNTTLVNIAQGTLSAAPANGGGGAIGGGGNIPPTQDDCGGYYQLKSPIGNFGDPNCEVTNFSTRKDKIYTLIQQKDPKYVYEWFNIILAGETAKYNPNAFNGNSTSGKGAYGLFQMNPQGRGNGQYDSGSVVWTEQINNAIQYNNTVLIPKNCIFRYWQVARKAGIAPRPCPK